MELSFPITQIALDYPAPAGPVGVSTFGAEDAVQAARMGADYFVIGHPLTGADDPLAALTHYVEEVKANYHSRH